MTLENQKLIDKAKRAALDVLVHNAKGPINDLPRTAGWGYPEPYTRDLLISALGIATTQNQDLILSLKSVLLILTLNQSKNGQIPSIVTDKNNLGSSDTTPLFLIAVGILRTIINDPLFLEEAVSKALLWTENQCPKSNYLVAQQPTSDWRDEQWVLGFGLYVNTLVYTGYKILAVNERKEFFKLSFNQYTYSSDFSHTHKYEGFSIKDKPYFALWTYKIYSSERFDLLGNSLAILSGLASESKANDIIKWIEEQCHLMRAKKELGVELPPNFFPYINPGDKDWLDRYEAFNMPGDYHNGGIWPFICGFYIAALVSIKRYDLAEYQLIQLTHLIKKSKNTELDFGFNEWYKAQNGEPMGQDWQTWSASNYLYAAACVEKRDTLFFDVKD
ncbi:alkaline and neutral invertase-like protein [Leeuwenhoekiella aestuarii]|uniref:beta-fructofuranosidase n=1 Tax=Leeuwenhoekiella aestuarii TaxID=2249426 RepID=A0A4V1KPD1_9FLAO|nr:glycoside hydrolase 100 family protein [Leeuwenhoekiella aestuarii]RXG11656.1 alkaline and neutral invertase-like protein [Leeuwenhoekiella aestuarii]RXG15133.1 alkaline and neutral invertase-like protein [Leeuwenhoekiella aestuarii]